MENTFEEKSPNPQPSQQKQNSKTEKSRNVCGILGFILSISGVMFLYTFRVSLIMEVSAFILSFWGVFKRPRGFAIAGLVISFVFYGLVVLSIFAISDGWTEPIQ